MSTINRSAKDGEFVSQAEADKNPDTTVKEQVNASAKKEQPAKKSGAKYYRSDISGLRILTGNRNDEGKNDPDLLDFEQFQARQVRWNGDLVKVGVLKTSTPYVQKVLDKDVNVQEISEKEYNELVG